MESFAYTHLALAAEEATSQELSNPEVIEFLTKLNLFVLLKPQKCLNKALIYGLCMSLALVPGNGALTLELAQSGEKVDNLASNPSSKAMLEKAPSSPSQEANEEIKSASISLPNKKNQEKVLLVNTNPEEVNSTNSVNTTTSYQTASLTKLIQYLEKKPLLSYSVSQAETTTMRGNKSPISKSNPDSKTEPEQKGKLRFVNDTPYPGIILFYKPGQQQPYTYLHVPPCKKRELYTTYSTWGKVSFNSHEVFSIGEASVKKGDFFEIKTSKLANKSGERNSCQDASINQPVFTPAPMSDNEIHYFINTVETLKKILRSQDSYYLNRLDKILVKSESATLLEHFTESLMGTIIANRNPNSNLTDYCLLEYIIKILNKEYSLQKKGFDMKDYKPSFEEIDHLKRSFPRGDLSGKLNWFPSDEGIKKVIIVVELYLNAYNALEKSFRSSRVASKPGFQQTDIMSQPSQVNQVDYYTNDKKCQARLHNGQLQASTANKKAKYC